MRTTRAVVALALLAGCRQKPAPQPPTPATPTSAANAASPTLAVAPSVAPSSSAVPPAVVVDQPCKALGKKGTTELSPINEYELQLFAAPEALYALGYTHELARVKLYRFSRAGGPVEAVAEQKGLGDRKQFTVAGGAAYYAQAGKLVRLGPEKGEAHVLYEGIQSPVAVVGDQVLGIACDSKAKFDRLLQIPVAGGEPQLVAELPHGSGGTCRYSSLVADQHDVFIADWNGHSVVAVSLADKSVKNIVTKRGFPGQLLLESDALVYLSTDGLNRVARDGSGSKRIADSDSALAPYSYVGASANDYWVFDALAYAPTTNLHRIPRAGGPAQTVMVLKNADPSAGPEMGQGLVDFAVDDQCVYVAQTQYKRAGIQLLVKAL
jgi:hypothetical protein